MFHGIAHTNVHVIPQDVFQKQEKLHLVQDHIPGIIRVVYLQGFGSGTAKYGTVPTAIVASIYDTDPVCLFMTEAEYVGWVVNKMKVQSKEDNSCAEINQICLNLIDM